MGCGSSTPAITHNISLHIINLNKFSEDEAEVVEVSKEVCKIKPKFNVIHYAYSSPILKFKDLFKDPKTIKGSAFLLYYHAQKEKQILNYSQCFQVVPYDEMMLIDAQKLLERIYILDTRTVSSLDMKLDDVLAQLDSDYEVVTRKIKINTAAQENEQNLERRNSVLNEFTQEEKEDETDQVSIIDEDSGVHIDVNKELTSEYLQAIVERIRKEKVSSITIRNNLFKSFNNFAFLITELIQNKNLKTFTFGDNHNTTGFDEGWMLITKLIAENKNLRHLYLSMSFLYDKYLKGIFKEALIGKRIKTLDLSSNFITYPGTRRIAEWLGTNKTLQVLALQQNTMNEFKKEGSDAIVEKLMTHKSITTLDLSNMILTGLGEKMGELIKSSRTLKELRIRGTRMNLDDFKHICLPMCGNELITEINLSENDTRNDKSLEYIAKMIKENKTLKIISLEKLGISNKNCQIIFDAIAQNETIENYSFTYHQKFKISTILDFFKNKSNAKALKVLTISAFDVKKNGEENDLVEKFKAERDDVNVKIS